MISDTHKTRRFYGRRKGHTLSNRQQEALEEGLLRFGISPENREDFCRTLDKDFAKNHTQVWLEIGFGKGEHLAWQAKHNPEAAIIGCEPFVNGVVGLIDQLVAQKSENVRIYPDDARDFLDALPRASLDRVFLLHPDPWPKKRHIPRRFVNQHNLDCLSSKMKDGALLRISTDHPDYARWVVTQMHKRTDFHWRAEQKSDWLERPEDWPETRYANKAIHPCIFFEYVKR